MDNVLENAYVVLSTTAARWQSLTGSLPVELLARAPAVNEWSMIECLQHLVDTEKWVFPARIKALLAGQDFQAFDPETQGTKQSPTPAELAAEFSRLRAVNLETLKTVTASDLGRTARHSELGLVTLGELIHEWAGHDLMHTVQAERALLQPFIAGCGPWRFYFADHDLSRDQV